jgi:hypothetical protein
MGGLFAGPMHHVLCFVSLVSGSGVNSYRGVGRGRSLRRGGRGGAIFLSGEVAGALLVLTSLPNDFSAKEVGNLSLTHALLLSPNSL